MRNSLIAKLIGFILLYPISINSVLSKNIDNHLLSNKLEESLNQNKNDSLKELFLHNSFKQFNKQYLVFSKNYTDAKWSIKQISHGSDQSFLDVKITSTREIGGEIYNLNSKQTIKVEMFKNKIKSFKVINEESILNSIFSPLVVKIISPDKVSTGEKYEGYWANGKKATEEEIIKFCRETLAGFKLPKKVVFSPLPKTSTGKIQKFELRKKVKELN